MGLVLDAFRRKRAQLYVPRPVKPGCRTPVIIEKPIRAIKNLQARLPGDERRNAQGFARLGSRMSRCLIEFGYNRFERITRYANYG